MTTQPTLNKFNINFTALSNEDLVHLIQLSTVELHSRTAQLPTPEVKPSLSVEAAKLVNELSRSVCGRVRTIDGGYATYNPHATTFKDHVEFISNPEKRTVVALLRYESLYGKPIVWARGIAKCCPEDTFDEAIGMVIALHRVLGIKVPEKFIK